MLTDGAEFVAAARTLDEAFARYANAGELDRLVAAYYTVDARVLPANAPPVSGRGQIREFWREMFEAGVGDMTLETTDLHFAGDLGYGVGTYTWLVRASQAEPRRDSGKYVLVYRRRADSTWKVAVDMFSSDLPAR